MNTELETLLELLPFLMMIAFFVLGKLKRRRKDPGREVQKRSRRDEIEFTRDYEPIEPD